MFIFKHKQNTYNKITPSSHLFSSSEFNIEFVLKVINYNFKVSHKGLLCIVNMFSGIFV